MNGYFEEINKNKYLIKRYEEMWSKIRDLISPVTKNSNEIGERYMKIKFNSDDELPLNKTIEIRNMTIVIKAVFSENSKYYPQVFLDKYLYKLWKNIKMLIRKFLKELMLLRQANQKSGIFVTVDIF